MYPSTYNKTPNLGEKKNLISVKEKWKATLQKFSLKISGKYEIVSLNSP